MSDTVFRQALDLEMRKRYAEAGEVWESCGQVEKAIANYQRASLMKRAIDLALKHALNRRAAELYQKAEIFDRAADLFRKERDYASAARALRQGGRVVEAAEMFEKADQLSEAARLYESANDFMKAGELYERAGELDSSARAYELAIDAKAIDQLGGAKDLARVAQVLTRVKNFEKAAEIYLQSHEVAEAVLLFVRMGEVEGAARLLANCQGDVGYEVLTRIDYSDPRAVDFARMFYVARDYGKAARVFESCGQPGKAAMLYEKNQDYGQAGEMYAMAQDVGRAAQMFEKAGSYRDAGEFYVRAAEPGRAAACFEAGEEFYRAGRLYFEVERYDKAVDLLQKVSRDDSQFVEASVLIAEILRRKGYLDLAVERYRQILSHGPCDAASVDRYYSLACILLEKREFAEAERLLSEVVRFRFGYRDAADLLEQARRLSAEPAQRLPAPPPAAAEPAVALPDGEPAASAAAAEPRSRAGGFVVGRMEGFEVLAATSLFAELTLAETKRFWESCERRHYATGGTIVEEGRPGDGLYVVRQGAVNVVKGSEIVVQLHAGEFFGEMSLIDPTAPTSARVSAARDVDLFFLGRQPFDLLLQSNDHTALKLYRVFVATLCARLRKTTEEAAELKARR